MIQDNLPNFDRAEAEAREQSISRDAKLAHLSREFIRFDKRIRLSKHKSVKDFCTKQRKKMFEFFR